MGNSCNRPSPNANNINCNFVFTLFDSLHCVVSDKYTIFKVSGHDNSKSKPCSDKGSALLSSVSTLAV